MNCTRRLFQLLAVAVLCYFFLHGRSVVVTGSFHMDFNLYFAGALIERQGSYTDNLAVILRAQDLGSVVPPEGVFGAPALIAFIFVPLTLFPLNTAGLIWDIGMCALILLALRHAAPQHWAIYLIPLAASSHFLAGLQYGNASTLTMILILFTYGEFVRDRLWRAALILGLAVALKVYPLFLVVVFLADRKWKQALVPVATATILTAASGFVLGWHDLLLGLQRLVGVGSTAKLFDNNISIPGTVGLLFGDGAMVQPLALTLLTAGAVVVALLNFRSATGRMALTIGLMLLCQSLTWGSYLTLALPMLIAIMGVGESTKLKMVGAFAFALLAFPAFDFVNAPSWWLPQIPRVIILVGLTICVAAAFWPERRPFRADRAAAVRTLPILVTGQKVEPSSREH